MGGGGVFRSRMRGYNETDVRLDPDVGLWAGEKERKRKREHN